MERLDLSDFDVRPNIESRQRLLAVPFEAVRGLATGAAVPHSFR